MLAIVLQPVYTISYRKQIEGLCKMASKLPYKVECKSSYPFYELIAAFDCEQAARAYADQCYDATRKYSYRVVKGKKCLASFYGAE